MKKIFLFTALLFSFQLINAQNLTLGQILEVKKKDLGNAEEYLTLKGWEFLEATEPSYDKMGSATFTYKKDDMSSRAESFLTFYYSKYTSTSRLFIQVNKKEKYNEYVSAIKGYGCKMLSSKVENGGIVKIYRGATLTFEVRSSTSQNFWDEETAIWTILITSNDDYDLNWGDE
jgi:hypothetical protein